MCSNVQISRISKIILVALIVFIMTDILLNYKCNQDYPVRGGRLDLSSFDLNDGINLTGEWNFNRDPGEGCATYHICVTGAKINETLAIIQKPLSSSYQLYIDGQLMTSCGLVGTSKDDSEPEYKLRTVFYTPKSDHFDLYYYVSNFSYARGGAWYAPEFSTPNSFQKNMMLESGKCFFLSGGLLFLVILLISMYWIHQDVRILFIIVFCILNLIRSITHGDFIISYFIPLSYNLSIRLDFLFVFMPCVYCFFFYSECPGKIHRNNIRIIAIYCIASFLIILLLPVSYLSQLTYGYYWATFIILLYIMTITFKALFAEFDKRYFLFFGTLVLVFSEIHDILLVDDTLITSFNIEYLPISTSVLIFMWVVSFIRKYELISLDHIRVMNELNDTLKREGELELKFLKSQIRPHFINNTLTTIISISRTDYHKTRELLIAFSKYLQGCYDMTALQDFVPIKHELELVQSYLKLEQARYGEGLKYSCDIDDVTVEIPPFILQPLVENSIIHGVKKKEIDLDILIYVKDLGPFIRIGVKDNGGGITKTNEIKYGVGLNNIERRLYMLFHTSLQIIPQDNGFFNVYMDIPKGEHCHVENNSD